MRSMSSLIEDHTLGKPECPMRAGLRKGLCRRFPLRQDGLHRHSIKRISASTNEPSISSVPRLPLLTICETICISGRTSSSARPPPGDFANIWISLPRLISDLPWEWISEGRSAAAVHRDIGHGSRSEEHTSELQSRFDL